MSQETCDDVRPKNRSLSRMSPEGSAAGEVPGFLVVVYRCTVVVKRTRSNHDATTNTTHHRNTPQACFLLSSFSWLHLSYESTWETRVIQLTDTI